ncbi:TetR family transcriptional regulator [Kocuria turfanensis]|uniref:TetR family transcriptional regulator n=1 Tax=Kocuria turfanensis TaxID=388357 RepID=A0A512IDB3_9MICC|nr:TetR family transcriptional regulator [Kocuria turfanensis]GEO95686.1 TetR family transcriptional regulator [Kocuria turfanensis]
MSLTRTAVVDAAWALLRTYGLGDLTMRRLAREMGVQPGALYWHVTDKQTLLLALAERMLEPVRDKDSPTELVTALRLAILEIRDGADVVAVAHALGSETLPPTTELVSLLRVLGLPDDKARGGALTLIRYTLGSVAAQQTRTSIAGRSSEEQDAMDEQDFEMGLETILRGLGASHVSTGDSRTAARTRDI